MAWFITFEGTDKAGKSTQIALFETYLRQRGIAYLFTREPGGCPVSERIREVILDPENQMHPLCEALLYAAARSELVHSVLLPQLQKGVNIVCDRYVDSSIAYQGFGREMGMDVIAGINAYATESLMPDLTFFLAMDPERARQRTGGTGPHGASGARLSPARVSGVLHAGAARARALLRDRCGAVDSGCARADRTRV